MRSSMQRKAGVKLVTVFATGVLTAATTVAVSGLGGSVTHAANMPVTLSPAMMSRVFSNL